MRRRREKEEGEKDTTERVRKSWGRWEAHRSTREDSVQVGEGEEKFKKRGRKREKEAEVGRSLELTMCAL